MHLAQPWEARLGVPFQFGTERAQRRAISHASVLTPVAVFGELGRIGAENGLVRTVKNIDAQPVTGEFDPVNVLILACCWSNLARSSLTRRVSNFHGGHSSCSPALFRGRASLAQDDADQ